ncbi:MAG: signal recognition particle-docking protein FtsY [Ignavibacteria bacterium]|nr:signal recognition particle-docking protein FtsY [Ignavibacteria bacterium]
MKLFKNLNFDKLKEGLTKTREKIVNRISETIAGKAKLDTEILDEIEEVLLTSDIGFETSEAIITETKKRLKSVQERTEPVIIQAVKEVIEDLLRSSGSSDDFQPALEKHKPFVIIVVGINGAGKTTTIGKLAHNFKQSNLNVVIGAADTFRAAANEQLEIWAKRAGVEIIQKGQGTDPSSVVYETIQEAVQKKFDVAIIDTAGRLHTKMDLMEELKKINRTIKKVLPDAPHETFLVLDGTTGQNALVQAEEFAKSTPITGLVITKLDGTAKGGAIIQICHKQKYPIRYIGIGESIDDLQTFSPYEFVEALFS